MPRPPTPKIRALATPMALSRLVELLDAYGARPERWPAPERAAALELLRVSEEARRRQLDAAALDAVLERASAPAPSPALFDRVVAAASAAAPPAPAAAPAVAVPSASSRPSTDLARRPGQAEPPVPSRASRAPERNHRARRVLVGAGGLATAAALALWLGLGLRGPSDDGMPAQLADIESYATATDALLTLDDLDVGSAVPSLGCTSAGEWGCPDLELPQEQSTVDAERSTVA